MRCFSQLECLSVNRRCYTTCLNALLQSQALRATICSCEFALYAALQESFRLVLLHVAWMHVCRPLLSKHRLQLHLWHVFEINFLFIYIIISFFLIASYAQLSDLRLRVGVTSALLNQCVAHKRPNINICLCRLTLKRCISLALKPFT